MRKVLLVVALAALTGCANQEYMVYAETQRKIAEAQAISDAAKYSALAEIAKQGDTAAKVAAVISINMMGNGSSVVNRAPQMAAPESFGDKALKWTGVLLPSLTQFYSINANKQIAVTQSNNATAAAVSNNQTMAAVAGSGFTAATNIASKIQAPTPNITVGGNYNVGSNSGNTGRIVTGNLTESTATPTVVTQPAPTIVTQPAPTIVTQPAPTVVTQPEPVIVTQPAAPTTPTTP